MTPVGAASVSFGVVARTTASAGSERGHVVVARREEAALGEEAARLRRRWTAAACSGAGAEQRARARGARLRWCSRLRRVQLGFGLWQTAAADRKENKI
jgi:hypothetical protein